MGGVKKPLSLVIQATSTICRGVSVKLPNISRSWDPPPIHDDIIEGPCVHLQVRPKLEYLQKVLTYSYFKIERTHHNMKRSIHPPGIYKWKLSSEGWKDRCQNHERLFGHDRIKWIRSSPYCGNRLMFTTGQQCTWSRRWIDITITDTCNLTENALYCQIICNPQQCSLDPQCTTVYIPPFTYTYTILMRQKFVLFYHRQDLGRYHLPMDHLINENCTKVAPSETCGLLFIFRMRNKCPRHCMNNTRVILHHSRTRILPDRTVIKVKASDISNDYAVDGNTREVVIARALHGMGPVLIQLSISVGQCAEQIVRKCSLTFMYRMTLLSAFQTGSASEQQSNANVGVPLNFVAIADITWHGAASRCEKRNQSLLLL